MEPLNESETLAGAFAQEGPRKHRGDMHRRSFENTGDRPLHARHGQQSLDFHSCLRPAGLILASVSLARPSTPGQWAFLHGGLTTPVSTAMGKPSGDGEQRKLKLGDDPSERIDAQEEQKQADE